MESALQWVAHILKLCQSISHKFSLFWCLFPPDVNPTFLARLQSEIIVHYISLHIQKTKYVPKGIWGPSWDVELRSETVPAHRDILKLPEKISFILMKRGVKAQK